LDPFIEDVLHELCRHKVFAERAMAGLHDRQFFEPPGPTVNPVASIVKHLTGKLASGWTDLLTAEGEKEGRDREGEFLLTDDDTRAALMASWKRGWSRLFHSIEGLSAEDLGRAVMIQGERQSVSGALLRGALHVAYHTGQILYLARWLRQDATRAIPAQGASRGFPGRYPLA
jgi:hypothetical protein